ncbi:MAG TPA: YfdX family protein [Geobacteraceae bacterium]
MKTMGPAVTICLIIITAVAGGDIASAQTLREEQARMFPEVAPREEATIQKTVSVALGNLARARAAIRGKAYARARHELAEADRLVRTIRQNLSTAVAKNLIGVARTHAAYAPPRRVMADLPPIYAALDAIDPSVPTDEARRHLDRARVWLEKGDKREAEQELALADRSLITIEVELPLFKLEKYLLRARAYLARGDGGRADAALDAAEQRMQALSAEMASPLMRAKRHLWLAFRNYSASRLSGARDYLGLAKSDLNEAGRTGTEKEKQEVAALSRNISGLEGKLNSRETGAEMLLRALWERSKAITERSAEYLAAGWEKAETTLSAGNDLIEAKLHVGYAETYQLTTREPDKAAEELGKADSYLKKAMADPLTGKGDRTTIDAMEKDVLALRSDPGRSDSRVKERYESLRERLVDLIRKL